MQVAVSPSDLIAVAEAARRIDGNPVALAGRALGFTPGEGSQIPTWAWYTVALVGGAAAGGWAISRWPELWPS